MRVSKCGYKFNRVRTALGQPPGAKGKTLKLRVSKAREFECGEVARSTNDPRIFDLSRQVVLSDAATVGVPEIGLEMSVGGRYTTVSLNCSLRVLLLPDLFLSFFHVVC